jgi:hypothetical protein
MIWWALWTNLSSELKLRGETLPFPNERQRDVGRVLARSELTPTTPLDEDRPSRLTAAFAGNTSEPGGGQRPSCFARKEQCGVSAGARPSEQRARRCGGCLLGHESDSAGRLLAGTSKAIGKRFELHRRRPTAHPSSCQSRTPRRSAQRLDGRTTRRVPRLATSASLAKGRSRPAFITARVEGKRACVAPPVPEGAVSEPGWLRVDAARLRRSECGEAATMPERRSGVRRADPSLAGRLVPGPGVRYMNREAGGLLTGQH